MKAILVLNKMPKSCCDCHYNQYLEDVGYRYCVADVNNLKVLESEEDDEHDLYDSRKSWCPLKPLPSFKAVDLNDTRDVMMFCHGWNVCLNEITGETE